MSDIFRIETTGARVATISETDDEVVEVQDCGDCGYRLIVHNRRPHSDVWDDLSATLTLQHLRMLGDIASHGYIDMLRAILEKERHRQGDRT